jgi:hypothetical protein
VEHKRRNNIKPIVQRKRKNILESEIAWNKNAGILGREIVDMKTQERKWIQKHSDVRMLLCVFKVKKYLQKTGCLIKATNWT